MANDIKQELQDIENLSFVIIDQKAAVEASEIAIQIGVRGMDALVIQVAKEFETDLISFDEEMVTRFSTIFKVVENK